jgi:predicted amidohydrolase
MVKKRIRIALAQTESSRNDIEKNLSKFANFIAEAKRKRAELVIFPELSLTGYALRDQIYEMAEPIPGPSVNYVSKLAEKNNVYVIFGMPELSDNTQATLHNSSVLVGPSGYIGKYRKMYLPTHSVFEEKRYFRPGYEEAVFETELGKLGLIICYDLYFPEAVRLPRLEGAQLIVCISASPSVRRAFFETLTSARAIENTAFLAFVNRVGIEDGLQFWGGSRLLGPNGKVLAQGKYDEEDLVICDVDYSDIRPIETFVPTLRDLRPELFDKLKQKAEKI